MDIKALIRDIPDFPKPGIIFKDITPVVSSPEAFAWVTEQLVEQAKVWGATVILGIDARGFVFGAPVANALWLPFVLARKPGKLPAATYRVEYALEYGTDALEMHTDAVGAGDRVMIIDDLLATGGTAEAACHLVEMAGARVAGLQVVIELVFLPGRERLGNRPVATLVSYE